jgi:hypothetical protein
MSNNGQHLMVPVCVSLVRVRVSVGLIRARGVMIWWWCAYGVRE